MLKNLLFSVILFSVSEYFLFSQDQKKLYHPTRTEIAPLIDGSADEPVWQAGSWSGDFIQHEPVQGILPSQKTEFCILYDNSNLYITIKAYDTSPDSIVRRLTRRDQLDGDFVGIIMDSYHDLRTGFGFFVSVAGVKQEILYSELGTVEDNTWDPIWFVKTAGKSWGWSAEMRIPLTQLRFDPKSAGVWGLNVVRVVYRKSEMSIWQATPRDASGFIHYMGEMDSPDNLRAKKQLDFTPYFTGGYENFQKEEGNPFATGERWNYNMGLDGKIGITNDMTLDFTINPDFGQVEADPSEVNLTAFETFFQEKRPFFIEGKNITSFGIGIGNGDIGNDNLFYSRRIGRQPQRELDLRDNEFTRFPGNTSILGAAKITGKTRNGWSVGIIESLTQKEIAKVDYQGERRNEVVEPLSNYFVGRIQKDFNQGNTIIGGIYTNTLRDLDNQTRDEFHRIAHTAGIDFTQYFRNKNWTISVKGTFSDVEGSRKAIVKTQESPVHYFQRPDASYLHYDINRTSLSGNGGILNAGKIGGKWNFLLIGLWKSPGLELNDAGYLRSADQLMSILWGAYHINQPFGVFRQMHFNSDYFTMLDYGFNFATSGYEFSMQTQFINFWELNINSNINTNGRNNTMLRGGPALKIPGQASFNYFLSTNPRKKISIEINGRLSQGFSKSNSAENYGLEINYKPSRTLNLEVEPEYMIYKNELQYIDETEQPGTRYLFGKLKQELFRMSVRINYSITPDFSIQYWGQPFAAAGNFNRFKMITDPSATSFNRRFLVYDPRQLQYRSDEDEFMVDENLDGKGDYAFENPNFNSDFFLSNLVVRWEFIPGSTIYLVWSQKREYSSTKGKFSFRNDLIQLFQSEKPYNIFLLKFSYRIGLH